MYLEGYIRLKAIKKRLDRYTLYQTLYFYGARGEN